MPTKPIRLAPYRGADTPYMPRPNQGAEPGRTFVASALGGSIVMKQKGTARAQALTLAVYGLLAPCYTGAAGAASADPVPATDPCKATVLRFERALAVMRETQGNKAGEELKEKLLPAKLQSEILFKDGYCGLARYIQEKKLDR